MIADYNARERVLDTSKSFIVQAPAGSGKTSILVQRFLALLAIAEHEPEEILAITFTRKAARQMRDRVIAALEQGLKSTEPEAEFDKRTWNLARDVLKRDSHFSWNLLYNPNRLKIQTIDSFCTNIAGAAPVLSRFGVNVQIEPQPEYLYERAVEQLLQELNRNTPWQGCLVVLLKHLANDQFKVKKLLIEALAIRDHWLENIANKRSTENLKSILEKNLENMRSEHLNQLEKYAPEILDYDLFLGMLPENIDDWLKLSDMLLTADNSWRRILTDKQGFASQQRAKTKEEKLQLKERKQAGLEQLDILSKGDFEDFKRYLYTVRVLPDAKYNHAQWDVIQALLEVLPVLYAQLIVVFKEAAKVDFVEQTLAALRVLPNEQINAKIKHILVDEFQDTSITQFKMLERMSFDTMFLVGDPMQSIYRFRQAEVGLFLQAKQQGIGDMRLEFVQLTTNFRSCEQIIDWNNSIFSESFPSLDNIINGAISYMPASAVDKQKQDAKLKCLMANDDSEGQQVVNLINDIRSKDVNASIAILVRAKTHLKNILPYLRNANIDYQGVALENLLEKPLVNDLLALTKALLHFDDRIAWLSILRAPWAGLTISQLQVIADFEGTIWQGVLAFDSNSMPLFSRFKQVLQQAINDLASISIAQLVKKTWLELGGRSYLANNSQKQEADAFFNILSEVANSRELYKLDYLEQKLANFDLTPDNTNPYAVQVMTIHKAKGLEFDAVILPGLGKTTSGDSQRLLLIDHGVIGPIKAANQKSDQIYDYLANYEKTRQEYESLRLLYVALTRAKSQIYMLADIPDGKAPRSNSLIAKVWQQLELKFQAEDCTNPALVSNTKKIAKLNDNWVSENPYLAIASQTYATHSLSWHSDWQRNAGIILHKMFQMLSEFGEQILENSEQIVSNYLRQAGVIANDLLLAKELVINAINKTLACEFGRNIVLGQHREAYTEWPLIIRDQEDSRKIVLDRVFLAEDNVFWLVDYKLVENQDGLSAAVKSYRKQLETYARAVSQLRSENLKYGLYFPLQGVWHGY